MKPTLTAIILIFFLSSCKSTPKEDENVKFEGNWVLKEVIQNTKTYQSISKAKELSDFYATELVFDQSGDSVSVYNGQEAYVRLPIENYKGNYSFQIRGTKSSPILYDSEDGSLFFADSTLNRVYRYLKADSSFLNVNFEEPVAFPSYINNSMIEGKWSRGPNEYVSFDRFGKINGWDDYNSFELVVNSPFGTNISGDLIIIRSNEKQLLFGFQRKKNTIYFYDLIATEKSNTYQNGKLLHEFTL